MTDHDEETILQEKAEQIAAWFEKHEEEGSEFDHIPAEDLLHPQDDICAMLKVSSLMKDPAEFNLRAKHDGIYFGDIEDLGDVTEEDVLYLVRCGVCWDDNGYMSKFV
jgi:uncharacterized protein (DUF934 family)